MSSTWLGRTRPLGSLPALSGAAPVRIRARFGEFEIHLGTGELWRGGRRVRIQSQPFRILALLIANAGELVTREDIRNELWGEDIFIEFDNSINASINKLRGALEDSTQAPLFVETLARRGYRFIAPVEWIEKSQGAADGNGLTAVLRTLSPKWQGWPWGVTLASLMLALLLVMLLRS